MENWEIEYQKKQELKNKLAKKIWDNPFHSGLQKFTKKELLILIDEILDRKFYEDPDEYDWDIKDIIWDQKCWMIETLNPKFFDQNLNKGEQYER